MIEYKNISVIYRGEDLFGKLNLEIKRNSKVLIVGKSGYGKSTLFSILLGFYKPDSGDVLFNNEKITEENIWEIRKKIAYVDQSVSLQNLTVAEWFDYVASLKANKSIDFSQKRILEKFKFFQLDEKIFNEKIDLLSGGEKQRLALITAILLNREIYLLDEPTSALDNKLKKMVVEYFSSFENKTIIVISHDDIWLNQTSFNVFDLENKKWVR